MGAIKVSLSPAAMTGGFSWANVVVQAQKPQRILHLSDALGFTSSQFGSANCRHLRRLHVFRTASLGRALHSTGVQLRPCAEVRVLSPAQEWVGLPDWRTKPLNELRVWGKRGPTSSQSEWEHIVSAAASQNPKHNDNFQLHWENLQRMERRIESLSFELRGESLAEWGAIVLNTSDPVEKAMLTHHAYRLWCDGELPLGVADAPDSPARPQKPELVHPRKIPPPSGTILTPSAHALHNLVHIELNAIDLAWDTVVRFSSASDELDRQFFADFAHVADDESRHCLWCLQRLAEMGFSYGDMPAHNLLLVDCQKTSGSVMARLAIIPMMQEARGLDAGPRLFDRLMGNGDTRSASMTKRIAEEEVGHVAVGVAWFVDVCKRLGLDPADRFQGLMKEGDLELRGPFNHSARLLAGLPRDWYDSSYDPATPDVDKYATSSDLEYSKIVRRSRVQVTKSQVLPTSEPHADGDTKTNSSGEKIISRLPELYDRLAAVVTMEQENADA